jgi:hypothetical protein
MVLGIRVLSAGHGQCAAHVARCTPALLPPWFASFGSAASCHAKSLSTAVADALPATAADLLLAGSGPEAIQALYDLPYLPDLALVDAKLEVCRLQGVAKQGYRVLLSRSTGGR